MFIFVFISDIKIGKASCGRSDAGFCNIFLLLSRLDFHDFFLAKISVWNEQNGAFEGKSSQDFSNDNPASMYGFLG